MRAELLGTIYGLIGVLLLVFQWSGVIAMRRQRNGAWWAMMVGTMIQTIALIGPIVAFGLHAAELTDSDASSGRAFSRQIPLVLASVGASLAGGITFASGFAIHGLTRRAAREREQQLEAMTAAMAEELRVLRERVG